MKLPAPGERPLFRALYLSGKSVAGKAAKRALSLSFSPVLVRLGAISLVAAGLSVMLGASLRVVAELREPGPASYMFGGLGNRLWVLSTLLEGPLALMLSGLGLAGILPLIPSGKKLARILATSGATIAVVSLPLPAGFVFYQVALNFGIDYGLPPGGLYAAATGLYRIAPASILLLCVAALWGRGFGGFRFLPLALGLVMPAASAVILSYLYSGETTLVPGDEPSLALALVTASPTLLIGAGWALFGCWMYGSVVRAARWLEKERRETEKHNLARTRRLYESIWRDGDLSAADNILAPEFRDLRQGGGPEVFKRSAWDLLRSFPDLELEMQSQRARKDAILTRCTFSGTDTGGVLWFPPTGKHATFSATFHDRFSKDGLAEHRGRFERESLLEQLGLSPTGSR